MLENLNLLKIFHYVALEKSFTKAAEKLFLTQPGISKYIKELENYLNTKLFERIGRKIKLTQAGEVLFSTTIDIFRLVNDTEMRIKEFVDLKGGIVKIDVCFTIGVYILPKVIRAFKELYPDVRVIFDISTSRSIITRVLSNEIDFGVISSEVNNHNLICKKYTEDELLLIIPLNHRFSTKDTIYPAELENELLLLPKVGASSRILIDNQFKKNGITLKNIMEFANPLVIQKAVEANVGLSILSKFALLQELKSGSFKIKKIQGLDLHRYFNIVFHKDKYINNSMSKFINLLLLELKNINSGIINIDN